MKKHSIALAFALAAGVWIVAEAAQPMPTLHVVTYAPTVDELGHPLPVIHPEPVSTWTHHDLAEKEMARLQAIYAGQPMVFSEVEFTLNTPSVWP